MKSSQNKAEVQGHMIWTIGNACEKQIAGVILLPELKTLFEVNDPYWTTPFKNTVGTVFQRSLLVKKKNQWRLSENIIEDLNKLRIQPEIGNRK